MTTLPPGTTNLGVPHIAAAQNTKETTINALMNGLDNPLGSTLTQAMADANQTLTIAQGIATLRVNCTGALAAGRNLVVPNNRKLYLILNSTTGGFAITVKTSAGSGIAVLATDGHVLVYCNGTNVVKIAGSGGFTFITLTDAPASYSGQSGAAVQVNSGGVAVEFAINFEDLAIYAPSFYGVSTVLIRKPFVRGISYVINLTTSRAILELAATAETIFSLCKNGVEFATIHFAAGGSVGAFSTTSPSPPGATTFAAGDILTIVAPGTPDTTAAGLGVTLVGTRV